MEGYVNLAGTCQYPQRVGRQTWLMPGDLRCCRAVVDVNRLNQKVARRGDHHREQRRFERQQLMAISGRPFGKQSHRLPGVKRLPQGSQLISDVLALRAGHEQSVVLRREPSDDRQCAYIVLRHEGRAGRAAHRQYIDPAQMVGHEKDVFALCYARDFDTNIDAVRGEPQKDPGPGRPHTKQAPNQMRKQASQ